MSIPHDLHNSRQSPEILLGSCVDKFIYCLDEEAPSYGNTCPQSIKKLTDKNDDVYVKWTPPKFTDNSNGQLKITTKGQTGTSTYPVGTTTIITYSATDAADLTTTCWFTITVISKYPS